MWANLGAGKTHCLYYLRHLLLESDADIKCLPIFIEVPEQIRSFHDLYRQIAEGFPLSDLAKAIVDSGHPDTAPDLERAARAICYGGASERDLAQQWLLGGRPYLRDLKRSLGIGARIEGDVAALDILAGIVMAMGKCRTRSVLMFDEFQRIAVLKKAGRESVLSNLRSIFSRNAQYFSVLVGIKSRLEESAVKLLPEELRTLLGPRPTLALPEMTPSEALQFVLERFTCFRPKGYDGAREEPFTSESLEAILDFLESQDARRMIPRDILHTLGWIYDEAAIDGRGRIDKTFACAALGELKDARDDAEAGD
jgi:hypothetical protein